MDITPELEQWMQRNRIRRSKTFLTDKIAKAEKRKFKSVLIPLRDAKALLSSVSGAA